MGYTLDTHLPLDVYQHYPFIYTGPSFGPFQVGLLPGVLEHRGQLIQRFYPLTIFQDVSPRTIMTKLFTFGFFYTNNEGKLIFLLTHPVWFDTTDTTPDHHQVMEFFINQVEDLARSVEAQYIDIEVHDEVQSSIAFPTSLTHLSYDLRNLPLDAKDPALLQSLGFRVDSNIYCYEHRLADLDVKEEAREYVLKSLDPTDFVKYSEKHTQDTDKAFSLSDNDAVTTFVSPRLSSELYVAYRRKRWFQKSEPVAFLQWSPNILEPALKHRLPVPLLFHDKFDNYPYEYAKIIQWAFHEESTHLYKALIEFASQSLKKRGIKRLQISHVNEDSTMRTLLTQWEFTPVHTIHLYRKPVT